MKLNPSVKKIRQQGAAMWIVSGFLLIMLVFTIPFYLIWVQTQHQSVAISQDWNAALPVAEAGIEEGMAYINKYGYSNAFNNGRNLWRPVDNWSTVSSNGYSYYVPTRRYIATTPLGPTYYDLRIIANTNQNGGERHPILVSVGYTPTLVSTNGHTIGAINAGPTRAVKYVSRQLRVEARLMNKFGKGLEAVSNIIGNGNFLVDSFNSLSPTNSFYGYYDSRYRLSSNGSIASIEGNIDLGANGSIYGTAATSSSGYLTNGEVGDANFILTNNARSSYESGFYDPAYTDSIEDVTLPDTVWLPLLACNCQVTYTNPQVSAATIITNVYPNPPPPGPVRTNSSGLVTTTILPNPLPSLVSTNLITLTLPYNPGTNTPATMQVPPGVVTNAAEQWFTNTASSQTTAPIYPTNYATPPGVLTTCKPLTNTLAGPPPTVACCGGIWDYEYKSQNGSNAVQRTKVDGVWQTNYTYSWIQNYAYKTVGSYSYTYTNYTYATLVYIYTGTNVQQQVVTTRFKYVVGSGDFKTLDGNLSLSGTEAMLVRGNARIYVPGSMSMSGNSQIIILPGASLTFYFGGDVSLGGQGIMNQNTAAINLQMYGLNTCTNISISGNAGFVGTLFAPYADIRLNGGGNDEYDIIGSITGKSVRANGKFQFHYDMALYFNAPADGFAAQTWIEERVGTRP